MNGVKWVFHSEAEVIFNWEDKIEKPCQELNPLGFRNSTHIEKGLRLNTLFLTYWSGDLGHLDVKRGVLWSQSNAVNQ